MQHELFCVIKVINFQTWLSDCIFVLWKLPAKNIFPSDS